MEEKQSATGEGASAVPTIGLLEWFEPGEHARAEQVIEDLHALGVEHLRTGFSWADWHAEGGEEWYAWLMPRLAEEVEVLPCFTYTPPALGIEPKCSSPPRRIEDYAAFVGRMIERFGGCFAWVELWNEPNNTNDWDWHLDHNWEIFTRMVSRAAEVVHARGKKTVLAGMCPLDPNWLDMMGRRGVLAQMDAVGVHAFPDTWTYDWTSWTDTLDTVRRILQEHEADAEVWITEAGYSTWQHDEYRQLQEFVKAATAPAERLYWYAAHDLAPDRAHQEGFHADERHYHLGLRQANGRAKLLFRVWAEEGRAGVEALAQLGETKAAHEVTLLEDGAPGREERELWGQAPGLSTTNGRRPVLITGGAGFIGANLAHRLLADDEPVLIYDSLARPGVEHNLRWLIETHGSLLSWTIADVRNPHALREAVWHAAHVFHLAGQVAVTTSLVRPEEDFAVNARGTLNLLEALRALEDPPPLVFTSTNKVYGRLAELTLHEEATRYVPADEDVRGHGISEARPIRFHSPYGCSKGAAEQYVLDYARTYGLSTLVFRMSCVYGSRQFGTEDQGWVSHFVQRTLEEAPITLYGDGKQVRDVLFIDDLVRALRAARAQGDRLAGEVFNLGGGPDRAVSLLELIDLAADLQGTRPPLRFADWRRGDQKYYVTDTRKFAAATGWMPQVDVREGVQQLYTWLRQAPAQAPERYTVAAQKNA